MITHNLLELSRTKCCMERATMFLSNIEIFNSVTLNIVDFTELAGTDTKMVGKRS